MRVYTPAGAGAFSVVVYFHGGGGVIANNEVYDGGARGLSKASKAIVVSVDNRLVPKAKFPAAWDDALAAYKHVTMNAAAIALRHELSVSSRRTIRPATRRVWL